MRSLSWRLKRHLKNSEVSKGSLKKDGVKLAAVAVLGQRRGTKACPPADRGLLAHTIVNWSLKIEVYSLTDVKSKRSLNGYVYANFARGLRCPRPLQTSRGPPQVMTSNGTPAQDAMKSEKTLRNRAGNIELKSEEWCLTEQAILSWSLKNGVWQNIGTPTNHDI